MFYKPQTRLAISWQPIVTGKSMTYEITSTKAQEYNGGITIKLYLRVTKLQMFTNVGVKFGRIWDTY